MSPRLYSIKETIHEDDYLYEVVDKYYEEEDE